MGLTRFVLSFFSSKILGEETIRTQVKCFNANKRQSPDMPPHDILASVYWGRAYVMRGQDPMDQSGMLSALSQTAVWSCLPEPECARALGIFILHQEAPHIIARYPQFAEEYARLMLPLLEASRNGTLKSLYDERNPNSPYASLLEPWLDQIWRISQISEIPGEISGA